MAIRRQGPRDTPDKEPAKSVLKRREDSDAKWKNSGLNYLKIRLDETTIKALITLCKRYEYEVMEESKAGVPLKGVGQIKKDDRIHVFSEIVGYCLRKEAGLSGPDLPEISSKSYKTRVCLALHRLRGVTQHVLNNVKIHAQDQTKPEAGLRSVTSRKKDTVDFLNKSGYPSPAQIINNARPEDERSKTMDREWQTKDIKKLLSEDYYLKKSTNKKKTGRPKS